MSVESCSFRSSHLGLRAYAKPLPRLAFTFFNRATSGLRFKRIQQLDEDGQDAS
jgi:hypothetical protein